MKRKPGLPNNFSLDVKDSYFEDAPPAELGDYLDDDAQKPPNKKKSGGGNKKVAGRIEPRPEAVRPDRAKPSEDELEPLRKAVAERERERHGREGHGPERATKVAEPLVGPVESDPTPRPAPARKAPRKQINMRPHTEQMAEELLRIVQTYSVQRDAKMSELFDALIAAAFDAKDEMDLSRVPARGRWGSPTAKVFTDALKSALQRAIAQHQRFRG